MPLGTIASIAAIVGTAASLANIGYQAAQGAPKLPSGAAASRDIANAQAMALPTQRALSAAEQQGVKVDYPTAARREKTQAVQVIPVGPTTVRGQKTTGPIGSQAAWVKYDPADWAPGGKYADTSKYIKGQVKTHGVNIPAGTATADFTGYGTADIQGELARKTGEMQQQLAAKYGVPFAEEAAREAELADPQGTAARKMEYDLIQQNLANPQPINPLSPMLENQIDQQLKAGSGLDPMSKDLLDQAVARSNADRSGTDDPNVIAAAMSQGAEGHARRQAAESKAQAFLSSGSSPADIAYRREQQNLADLSSFMSGKTPESQFQQLSGAAQGATPFVQAQPAPTMPGGAAQTGAAAAGAQYSARAQQALAPNPWLAGISSLMSSVSALGKATG